MKPNHIHVTIYADGGVAVGPTDQPITPWTQRHSKSGAPRNVAECVMHDVGATIADLREDGLVPKREL